MYFQLVLYQTVPCAASAVIVSLHWFCLFPLLFLWFLVHEFLELEGPTLLNMRIKHLIKTDSVEKAAVLAKMCSEYPGYEGKGNFKQTYLVCICMTKSHEQLMEEVRNITHRCSTDKIIQVIQQVCKRYGLKEVIDNLLSLWVWARQTANLNWRHLFVSCIPVTWGAWTRSLLLTLLIWNNKTGRVLLNVVDTHFYVSDCFFARLSLSFSLTDYASGL